MALSFFGKDDELCRSSTHSEQVAKDLQGSTMFTKAVGTAAVLHPPDARKKSKRKKRTQKKKWQALTCAQFTSGRIVAWMIWISAPVRLFQRVCLTRMCLLFDKQIGRTKMQPRRVINTYIRFVANAAYLSLPQATRNASD